MKILLGADQYPEYINGAANFTARLATGLTKAGHTVDLLWPSADGVHETYLDGRVRIHRLSSISLPGKPRMQVCSPWTVLRQVEQILQIAHPDVVHVQSHLSLGRTLLRAAKAAGLPVLATNHFMPENLVHHVPLVRQFPDLAARVAWHDLERVFAGADLITAPTQRAVDLLAGATDLAPAQAISCGIDLSHYAWAGTRPTRGRPQLLFVGRLEQEKHVDELLAAFALVPASLGARLEIVGMGSLRAELEAQVTQLGLGESVRFAGAVSDAELLRAYARADVFVMPGTAELQSLATLEAMAAGRPVVGADAMALPHLIHHEVNGYLYRPGDVAELAGRLTTLVGDRDLRARLGAASLQIAERHSMAKTLAAFQGCYDRLLGIRRAVAVAPVSTGDALDLVA